MKVGSLQLRVAESVGSALREQLLAFPETAHFPFLHPDWLGAFEKSQTVLGRSGWIPRHLTFHVGELLVAFVPGYIKLHSFGEFVFDQSWAQCSELQLGVPYYPKFIVGVPFTPTTGPRFLFHPDTTAAERAELTQLIAMGLIELCKEWQLSSVHVLFCDDVLGARLEQAGFTTRLGVQYQFHNSHYRTFEEYLSTFRAKKRANIRRERREVIQRGFSIEARCGPALTERDARLAYELYLTTVDKHVWGRRYLNQGFFECVLRDAPHLVHFVTAKNQHDQVVAGAFNLLGGDAIYGRYWGTFVDEPFLHFDVCLYTGIEETIKRGLARFEAGAGGEHKQNKGLAPTITRSSHFIVHPRLAALVRDFCKREGEQVFQISTER